MNYSKAVLREVIKSTFLTLALFTLFDIFIQGYSTYHTWVLTFFIAVFCSFHLLRQHHLSHHK